ncbi:hypothetical protein A9995_07885 [Erythrobacter sp. QSSC1-22B]|uniref:hypothetical protein n=1 Tax=Erythrobacter sp. QSSC1-22B TaxID=1860125 RepID=UPI000805B135|nr:hypothetical protein [Erythrobacter sp. QSSC1-22B]OBX19061.1 hypothetical protein A9995_07885 [Erythrobacter sp. QSSC1-22B]
MLGGAAGASRFAGSVMVCVAWGRGWVRGGGVATGLRTGLGVGVATGVGTGVGMGLGRTGAPLSLSTGP